MRAIGVGASVLLIALLVGCGQPIELEGTWKDSEEDYYIRFEGNKYVESTYNIARQYTYKDDVLSLYDIHGVLSSKLIGNTYNQYVELDINGISRKIKKYKGVGTYFNWDTNQAKGKDVVKEYTLLTSVGEELKLRMYGTKSFTLEGVSGLLDSWGVYCETAGKLVLLSNGGTTVDILNSEGNYLYSSPLIGTVRHSSIKINPIEVQGYTVEGEVYDDELGTTYYFDSERSLTKKLYDGKVIVYQYTVDENGLIKCMSDSGTEFSDYMYLSKDSGEIYRYVFRNNKLIANSQSDK